LTVVEHQSITHPGRVRRSNEDAFHDAPPLFVVADGMGGARAGEVASAQAIAAFRAVRARPLPPEDVLRDAVRDANRRIVARAADDPATSGMGTTVTAALVVDGRVAFAHVGDSRAYLLRDGVIQQLSDDHSLVGELVRRGALSAEEAAAHPQRSVITRALGSDAEVEVDTFTVEARDGDVFLLCSDGASGMLGDERLGKILRGARSLNAAASEIVRLANAAGGEDNITAVLFRIGDGPVQGLPEAEDTADVTPEPAADPEASGGPAEPPLDEFRFRALEAPRRRVGALRLLSAGAAAGLLIALGAFGLQFAHFVGASGDGHLAVYQGVPFELPFGVRLYRRVDLTAVPVAALTPAERGAVLDHRISSESSAKRRIARLPAATVFESANG
jgi:protein phosphatase